MDRDFWHDRWQQQQIGFHQAEVNSQLVRHHAVLLGGTRSRVLVPLCGKSLDLVWLAAQGHEVVGVELSPLAVQAFFEEQKLSATVQPQGGFTRHAAGNLEIFCGDFFEIEAREVGTLTAWFDRAALVALPESMRARYVAHTASLLPSGARGLLVAFEYEPASVSGVSGPPFSLDEAAVRALYDADFELRVLERGYILDREPRFRERGITSMHEQVYQLTRR